MHTQAHMQMHRSIKTRAVFIESTCLVCVNSPCFLRCTFLRYIVGFSFVDPCCLVDGWMVWSVILVFFVVGDILVRKEISHDTSSNHSRYVGCGY